MNKIIKLTIISGILLTLFSTVSIIPAAQAEERGTGRGYDTPYYYPSIGCGNKAEGTYECNEKLELTIKFTSDCWINVYARATPKADPTHHPDANHVLLNYQYFYNNDAPDIGRSEVIKKIWYFNELKLIKNSEPDRFRVYAEIEFPDDSYGVTKTVYIPFYKDKNSLNEPYKAEILLVTNNDICKQALRSSLRA